MENSVSADILVEFFEVAVHSILYARELYPHSIFEKRKKYNVPVYMSVHVEVNKYIEEIIESIRALLPCNLDKIAVVIANNNNRPLEKFIFEINVNRFDSAFQLEDTYLLRLEQSIRAFCLKLSTCDSILSPLPPNCTFAIQINTNECAAAGLDAETRTQFPWIEADPHQVSLDKSHIIPLKFMEHEILKMQLYVEECEDKK